MDDSIYPRLLDNLNTAVLLLNQELRIEYLNTAAQDLLGASASRICGQPWREMFAGGEPNAEELSHAAHSGQPYTSREVQLQLSHGETLTVDYTVTPIAGENRYLILEVFPKDRWLRISREENLLWQQEASKSLIRGLAHEIKNPLGGIRGAAQLLARELNSPQLDEYTNVIIEESDRLRNLVDQMLGSPKPVKYSPLNIHEAIERVRSLIESEAGGSLRLVRDYDPSIPEIQGNKEQLIQALLNITRNAMQSLQEARTEDACIRLVSRAVRQITLGPKRHKVVCRIDIIDNGPGVPPELQDTIFYPMISGSAGGTGLGLTLAQRIIGQHGGLIEHHSTPGHTCFSVFIPFHQGD